MHFQTPKPSVSIAAKRRLGTGRPSNQVLDGFSNVDASQDPWALVRHLDDAQTNPQVRYSKAAVVRELLEPQSGDRILEVGCGAGHNTQLLGRLVGHKGKVVGIDCSETMIRTSQRKVRPLHLPVEFRLGDAHRLDFPNETFDRCLVASTFMHLEKPRVVVSEIVRVLKPGGRLTSLEPDWDTIVLSTGDAPLDARIVGIIRRSVRHSGIAHCLPGYFREAGLTNISVQAATWLLTAYSHADETWRIRASVEQAQRLGTLSSTKAARLLELLRQADIRGMFFGSSTGFAVAGTKL